MPPGPSHDAPGPDRPAPAAIALLAGLSATGPLSIDMLLPALPRVTEAFAAEVVQGQFLVSAFLLGFGGGQLLYGPLSDRLGRRPVLLGGMALYTAASLACLVAPSLAWLIAARLAHGLGACAGPVLARAVVRDTHAGAAAARALAFVNAGLGLAPILAPLVGGAVLAWFDWRGIFAVLLGVGLALAAASGLMLAETNLHRDPGAHRPGRLAANYLSILRDRTFLGYLLTLACASGTLFAFLSGAPFVLIGLFGLTPSQFAMAFSGVMVGHIAGSLLSGRLALRASIPRVTLIGLAFLLLGGAAMAGLAWAGVAHAAAVAGPMAVIMFGNGLVFPSSMAGAILPFPRMAGAASALVGSLQMVTGFLVGIATGALHDGTSRPMAYLILGSAAAAAIAFRLGVWPRAGDGPGEG